jgi:hypothetical protein
MDTKFINVNNWNKGPRGMVDPFKVIEIDQSPLKGAGLGGFGYDDGSPDATTKDSHDVFQVATDPAVNKAEAEGHKQ